MGVNSLPKTVTRQRRGCDLNPGPAVPESSRLTIRLLGWCCECDTLFTSGLWMMSCFHIMPMSDNHYFVFIDRAYTVSGSRGGSIDNKYNGAGWRCCSFS